MLGVHEGVEVCVCVCVCIWRYNREKKRGGREREKRRPEGVSHKGKEMKKKKNRKSLSRPRIWYWWHDYLLYLTTERSTREQHYKTRPAFAGSKGIEAWERLRPLLMLTNPNSFFVLLVTSSNKNIDDFSY